MSKKKKYKINVKRFAAFIAAVLLLIAGICVLAVSCSRGKIGASRTEGFLASENTQVLLLCGQETVEKGFLGKVKSREISFTDGGSLPRGTAVTLIDEPEKDEDGNVIYEKIDAGGQIFYIKPGQFTEDQKGAVKETTRFVRTSATMYEKTDDAKIAGFARKGSELTVLDFDKLSDDGSVNMYKVSCGGQEGWVFGKYLVGDKETADAMYDEHGEVETHKDAVFSFELYGGDPLSMDYYPVEKPRFEDNPLLEDVRAMYVRVEHTSDIDDYIEVAVENGANAICLDIYDDILGFDSRVAKEFSPTTYENTSYLAADYGNAVQKIKDAGLYAIGRIIVFNDKQYAADHPEDCIYCPGYDEWPSAYSRNIWYYKVSLAIEAVRNFGFNEIQFDYIRFPESTYGMSVSGNADFKNVYGEDKCEAVQNFLFYACDMLHREGVYVSADVFGESAYGYVAAYGQYWPTISNVVDVISAMPYVDHFSDYPDNIYASTHPYETVHDWAEYAARRQKEIPTPAIARTWITAYDVPWQAPSGSRTVYGAYELAQQAQGLWDAGLTGGFLTWNVANDLAHYRSFGSSWSRDYAK